MPKGIYKRNNSETFYDWCIENNRQDLLDRWDCSLNKCSPKDITFKNNTKRWFKCPLFKHPSELKRLSDIVSGHSGSEQCLGCNSFGQYLLDCYGDDALIKYWDWDKNEGVNPFQIKKCCHKDIWIYCQDKSYHESYSIKCNRFVHGERCPYCHSLKVHRFDSLGWLYPEVFNIWSDNNVKSPYDYTPQSHYRAIWICNNGHDLYRRSIKESYDANFRCSECVREHDESYLQERVRLYVENKYSYYKLLHEWNCTLVPHNPKNNYSLPFDNELIIGNKHLIIEVNGEQHYETISYGSIWNKKGLTPEQQLHKRKLYDRYKRYVAFCNGYFYIAIPYWDINKVSNYKSIIDNKIKEIQAFLIKLESA